MRLLVERKIFTGLSTIGELSIDGTFQMFTLENPIRGEKPHVAIPAGVCPLILSWSPRFSRKFPLLVNVPGFDGVRIHYGCFSRDTAGCLLVGQQKGPDRLYQSRPAFRQLLIRLSEADLNHQAMEITIR